MSDPDSFIKTVLQNPQRFSAEFAEYIDSQDPLALLRNQFDMGDILPFAGHSLGPAFIPAQEEIAAIYDLQQRQLPAGHFPETETVGGNWFDCDIEPEAITAIANT